MRNLTLRFLGAAVLAAAASAFVGCEEEIESRVQYELDNIWDNAATKADFESDAEDAIDDGLSAELVGDRFTASGTFGLIYVTVENINDVSVDLGNDPPEFTVPWAYYWESSTDYCFLFFWEMDWGAGNDAEVNFDVKFRSVLVGEIDVRVYDITAHAEGGAFVTISKSSYATTLEYLNVSSSSVSLSASASKWFLTVDVTNMVEDQVDAFLGEAAIEAAIRAAFEM